LEETGREIVQVLFWHFLGGPEEDNVIPQTLIGGSSLSQIHTQFATAA